MSSSRDTNNVHRLGWKAGRRSFQMHGRGLGTDRRFRLLKTHARPALEQLEGRQLLATFVVTNPSDNPNVSTGTLRWAMNQVNGSTDPSNVIDFDMMSVTGQPLSGPITIDVTSALPTITKPVTIDGTSEPGFSGAPLIDITGDMTAAGTEGIVLGPGSSGSVIQSLVIGGFEGGTGIQISSSYNVVTGCYIGTDTSGENSDSNSIGISVDTGTTENTIGGTSAGAGNVISGNVIDGIDIDASCLLEGNWIGTDITGASALGNGGAGVYVLDLASGTTIGGTSAGAGNVISGNTSAGIAIEAACLVEGNRIGTDITGTISAPGLGNDYGILVYDSGATIGGTSPGAGNVISGNAVDGIFIDASCLVEGNRIGTDITGVSAVGNGGDGIFVEASGATIGVAGAGNMIAFSGRAGAAVGPGITGSSIQDNAIFDNAGPGIDLNDNGVTPNTPNGPNNTPILTSVTAGMVSGTLNAAPNGVYTIDFYANPPDDASAARPQGRDWLVAITVETNAAGDAVFDIPYTPLPGVPFLTATATDAIGTTSEFSPPVAMAASAGGVVTPMAHSVEFVAGTLFNRVAASFLDSAPSAFAGEFSATINWGDSSAPSPGTISADGAGFDVSGSHTYNVAGSYPVTVTITDALTGASVIADSTASVDPVPLVIQTKNFAVTPGSAFSGTVATFTDGDPRNSPGFYTTTINWGDGSNPTTGTITGANPFTVTASHTFAAFSGTDIVTVTISDKNGDGRSVTGYDRVVDPPAVASGAVPAAAPAPSGAVSAAAAASPAPATPAPTSQVLAIAAKSLTLSPKQPFHGAVATFTDSGPVEPASAYKAIIQWGKGHKSAGLITGINGEFVVSIKRAFPKFAGKKRVTVMVTDPEGHAASISEPVSFVRRRVSANKALSSSFAHFAGIGRVYVDA